MALAKLDACAGCGAVIGGGAVHVAERPRAAKTRMIKKGVVPQRAAPVRKRTRAHRVAATAKAATFLLRRRRGGGT